MPTENVWLASRTTCVVITVATLLVGATSFASTSDLMTTRAMGMGGALRASASGPSGVFLNPAGMSLTRAYVVGALYHFRTSDSASEISAQVVDSITSRIAAGLYYSFLIANPDRLLGLSKGNVALDTRDQTHEVGLSLSMPLGSWLMLGMTGKYINHHVSLPETAPEDLTTASISKVGMDAGGIVCLGQSLRFAVVGHNIIAIDDALYPQSLGLGLSYSFGPQLTAEFDTVLDFTSDPDGLSTSFHGGLEALLADRFAVRLGALHDTYREATHLSAGVALVSQKLTLQFAVRQQVDGGAATVISSTIQLRLQ